MSPRSSSGSWAARGTDIIDLDRFMRGARPPSHTHKHNHSFTERLVVDGGGGGRKAASSSGRSAASRARYYSHDSGLSDGSYRRRRSRPAGPREAPRSEESLRAFRAVCERALLDQQQQIARVALLCERLTEREPPPPPKAAQPPSADTSDLSSSSRSTRDQRRKDKHRTDECKTYKIIMNKLDELNRLFSARARSPPARGTRRREPSSGSVSVSDKLVATEPPRPEHPQPESPRPEPPRLEPPRVTRVERATGSAHSKETVKGSQVCSRGVRGVTHTHAVNLPPARPHHAAHSVIRRDSSCESRTSACDPRCGFDLDDPVHLYCQAKRMQEGVPRRGPPSGGREGGEGGASLCAWCRAWGRAVRHFLAATLGAAPQHTYL